MSSDHCLRRPKRARVMADTPAPECKTIENPIPVILIDDDSPINEYASKHKPCHRRSKNAKVSPVLVKLAPIFLPRKDLIACKTEFPVEVQARSGKKMKDAIRDFLYSGLPEPIVKTQTVINKIRAENQLFETFEIFPVVTHLNGLRTDVKSSTAVVWTKSAFPFVCAAKASPALIRTGILENTTRRDFPATPKFGEVCCGINSHQPSNRLACIMEKPATTGVEPIPWVVNYPLKRHGYLAVEKESGQIFADWLKQWRRDIREDGGSSRKIILKRKKVDGDDDFIDDGFEVGPEKHKSVVLTGPTGSGKSTMVNVMASRYGFKVLEVNFSSRRCGAEVLRRVEEATLSRRLATHTEVDHKNCLILFRDIDLYVDEDEGFYTALAQLIASSLRPIVMTISTTDQHQAPPIDSRIEKKEPLVIHISAPSSDTVVSDILFPVMRRVLSVDAQHYEDKYSLDDVPEDINYIKTVLRSVARHCKGDIKKSINHIQFLWHTSNFSVTNFHAMICPKLKVDIVMKCSNEEKSASKPATRKELNSIANKFKFVSDLDRLFQSSVSDPDNDAVPHDFDQYLNSSFESMLALETRSDQSLSNLFRRMVLVTEIEMTRSQEIGTTYHKILTQHEFSHGDSNSYDEVSYFRNILKTGVINSVGQNRRHRRIRQHFPNIPREDIYSFCDNFDFTKDVNLLNY